MSEQTPRKGDTVLVSFKATWDQDRGSHYWMRDLTDGSTMSVPADATVEVLERADDPSKDAVGSRREMPANDQSRDDSAPIGPFAFKWSEDADTPWVWFRWDGPQLLSNGTVADWPLQVSGPAEAEKPDPSSHESHCKDLAEAIYASHIYPWEDLLFTARRYATHAIRDEQADSIEQESATAAPVDEEYPEVSGAGVPFPVRDAPPLGSSDPPGAGRFRYFSKRSYLLHRITPDGTVQFRHPDDGWTDAAPPNSVTVDWLESQWDEVGDVEPIGGVS